jgi:hypothetical protein
VQCAVSTLIAPDLAVLSRIRLERHVVMIQIAIGRDVPIHIPQALQPQRPLLSKARGHRRTKHQRPLQPRTTFLSFVSCNCAMAFGRFGYPPGYLNSISLFVFDKIQRSMDVRFLQPSPRYKLLVAFIMYKLPPFL